MDIIKEESYHQLRMRKKRMESPVCVLTKL
jgi:hypothetical protein